LLFSSGARPAETDSRYFENLKVTATAYTSTVGQTDALPYHGAWGDRLNRLKPGVRVVAVSPDLLRKGLKRGQRVWISGFKHEFIVMDRTAARWQRRVDIYMGDDLAAAQRWGKRRVTLSWETGNWAAYAHLR
jgi:3D (Asp-Asp-Asp) domain-containing protein